MRVRRERTAWVVGLILLVHMVLAGAYSVWVPLGESPDEADHWAYIQYLAREHRLPRGPELTQAKHPPLYHAGAALVALAVTPHVGSVDSRLFLRSNPDVSFRPADVTTGAYGYNSFIHTTYEDWPWQPGPRAFHWARFWSVLLSTLTVWVAYRAVRLAFASQGETPAILAAAFVAFLPEFAFIGGVLNNDTMAALLAGLALWGGLAMFRSERWLAGWWTPVALGLGVWAKVSTLAMWPVVIWLSGTPRRRASSMGWTTGLAAVLAAPWFIRNVLLYGDPLGMALVRATVDVRTTPWTWADTRWLISGWFHSFWGKFGSAGHIPMAPGIYAVLVLVSLIALLGLGRGFWNRSFSREMVVLFGVAVISVAAAIWRYSLIALGTDQGRLLFPALVPISGLVAAGWLAWVPRHRWPHVTSLFVLALGVLGIYGGVGVIRPAYAPPPSAHESEHVGPSSAVRFGSLALVGWEFTDNLTLYWQAQEPIAEDVRVVVRFVDESGHIVWEWKRSPGAGRWSTDHWPRGYVMRDVYPSERWQHIAPGDYRVEVGAYVFMGDYIYPQGHASPFVPLGEVKIRE